MDDFNQLLDKANQVYLQNHKPIAWFGRCIFLSWFCTIGDCDFCYRTTIKSRTRFADHARRSIGSILSEAILARNLGWHLEFLTGGFGIYPIKELVEITKMVSEVYGKKVWLNLGILSNQQIELFKPYVDGICASIETVEPELHKKVCPSKPIEPFVKMYNNMPNDLEKSMTFIVGLGEKKEDINLLHDFIEKNKLDRITFYALKPVKGTPYEKGPDTDYYAWWIANTRVRFPKLVIIAGTTARRVEEIDIILKAGANAITKFPATKLFGHQEAHIFTEKVRNAGREFVSTLTKLPDIDWDAQIDSFNIPEFAKVDLKEKLHDYLKRMSNPLPMLTVVEDD